MFHCYADIKLLLSCFLNTSQYAIGRIVEINIIEINVPKNITVPIGAHNALRSIIIGNTPTDAAAEVKNSHP